MSDSTPTMPELSIEQLRALLNQAVENENAIRQAQTTVLLAEEGGQTFLQGIVERAETKTTERWVGKSWEGFTFTADDGTEYSARVVLTDVEAKKALPTPAPRAKK